MVLLLCMVRNNDQFLCHEVICLMSIRFRAFVISVRTFSRAFFTLKPCCSEDVMDYLWIRDLVLGCSSRPPCVLERMGNENIWTTGFRIFRTLSQLPVSTLPTRPVRLSTPKLSKSSLKDNRISWVIWVVKRNYLVGPLNRWFTRCCGFKTIQTLVGDLVPVPPLARLSEAIL